MVGHCFARRKARCFLLVARRWQLVARRLQLLIVLSGWWPGKVWLWCQAEVMGAGAYAYIAGATMMTKERAFTLRRSPAQ